MTISIPQAARLRTFLMAVTLLFSFSCGGGGPEPRSDAVPRGEDVREPGKDMDTTPDLAPGDGGVDSAGPGCDESPAPFGCPCLENGDCGSLLCTLDQGEKVCSKPCVRDCPEGWSCDSVQMSAGDPQFFCLSLHGSLCLPCGSDEDCGSGSRCLSTGPLDGAFCGTVCSSDGDCPTGFSCEERQSLDGVGGRVCVSAAPCECSAYAVSVGLAGACSRSNSLGTCRGWRACGVEGLGACLAAEPSAEQCNGLDDDCDGLTDPPGTCPCECGNGTCDRISCGEDEVSCPQDCCANLCGNGICDPSCGEALDPDFCRVDCCTCGDGNCDFGHCNEGWGGETGVWTCSLDCALCGNGVCEPGEGPPKCEADCCGPCGDHLCRCDESPANCPVDCTYVCGDGQCSPGEGPDRCVQDCEPYTCGNQVCEPGEDPRSCTVDCGTACGDCICESGESYQTCPIDCGYCGDGYCISHCPNNPENTALCPLDCSEGCAGVCNSIECGVLDDCFCGECDDGDPCTLDLCSQSHCQFPPDECDDGNPCTQDHCEPGVGCVNVLVENGPCDDGNHCTLSDTCLDGHCYGSGWDSCDDGLSCTQDSCNPTSGCVNVPDSSLCPGDGIPCTEELCSAELGCVSLPVDEMCDDGVPCNEDYCDLVLGCVHEPEIVVCDDITQGFVAVDAGSFWMGSPEGGAACPIGYTGAGCSSGSIGTMAGELGRYSDERLNYISLTHDFEIQIHEVTQGEWAAAWNGWNPSAFPSCGPDCPVDGVTWFGAVAYANYLSEAVGLEPCYKITAPVECVAAGVVVSGADFSPCMTPAGEGVKSLVVSMATGVADPYHCTGYRLPTEAEWEYSARAGSLTALYPTEGNSGALTQSGWVPLDPNLDVIAWYGGNSAASYEGAFDCSNILDETFCGPHEAGTKAPNAWDLYDMSGNLWEWCWDWMGDYALPSGTVDAPRMDPLGPNSGTQRVLRGGSWLNIARSCRSAVRFSKPGGDKASNMGFRLVRTLHP